MLLGMLWGICQGMSWQHQHQPCVAGRCSLSVSTSTKWALPFRRSLRDVGYEFETTALHPVCFDIIVQLLEALTAQRLDNLDVASAHALAKCQCIHMCAVPPVVLPSLTDYVVWRPSYGFGWGAQLF